MLNLKKGAHKSDNYQYRYRDTADDGPEDCSVCHSSAPKQARYVTFEMGFGRVVIGDCVQDNRSINYSVKAADQHGNECCNCAEHERRRGGLRNDLRQLTDCWYLRDHRYEAIVIMFAALSCFRAPVVA